MFTKAILQNLVFTGGAGWPGTADILLSCFFPKLLFLKFHGVHIPQRGMTAPAVVKHLDVIDDILSSSRSAEIPCPKYHLNFEAAEETLCDSIVPAIAFSGHTGQNSMVLEQFLEIMAAILAAPVRVKDETS